MSQIELRDQWVLVTGASAGHGREFARALAKMGAHLVVCARSEQRLAQLADELGTQVRVVSADFDGMRTLQRHQLVYRSLGDLMQTDIHTLRITALTPDEAR